MGLTHIDACAGDRSEPCLARGEHKDCEFSHDSQEPSDACGSGIIGSLFPT